MYLHVYINSIFIYIYIYICNHKTYVIHVFVFLYIYTVHTHILLIVWQHSFSYLCTAKCIGQQQFRDQYFDSPDFILTLKDFWLRRREGLWELKSPAVSGTTPDNDTETLCTRYREITSLPLIQSEVSRIIREHTAEGSESNSSQREQIDKVTENEDTEICSADDTKWLNDLNLVCLLSSRPSAARTR